MGTSFFLHGNVLLRNSFAGQRVEFSERRLSASGLYVGLKGKSDDNVSGGICERYDIILKPQYTFSGPGLLSVADVIVSLASITSGHLRGARRKNLDCKS